MANRLENETSPYLLQHKDNPVDWYPWGDEAFEKARAEDKPVFLSVGYASCHWCHVMEHESFEDEATAKILNENFVSVKVDREERPDVDEAYMTAVQLSQGRGGWPMSVFMTPDRKPFFAGTYFPKEDRGQYPGFGTILKQIVQGWKTQRAEFVKVSQEFATAVEQALTKTAPQTFTQLSPEVLTNAVQALAADFDREHAGFGAAPKFPPHTTIEFLINFATLDSANDEYGKHALMMALTTLERMAFGGIHDHVGGGFHRYSTDAGWLLPHFEKMLYDNAMMLLNYAQAARLVLHLDPNLGAVYARVAAKTVEWLDREMLSPEGLFYSAVDADSEGEEGKFYVWSSAEVREILGENADGFLKAYSFQEEGNYEDEATHKKTGKNIPHLQDDDQGQFEDHLDKLLEYRNSNRVRPSLDDKALIGWNGLMIRALAEAGEFERAQRTAKAVLELEKQHGALPHMVSRGKPSGIGYLDDYANFIFGILGLAEAEGESTPDKQRWVSEAQRLLTQMIALFYDEENGGFFGTSESHELLFGRSKPVVDQPAPSGNAIAVRCLLRLGEHERAERTLQAFVGWMERAPQATEAMLLGAAELFQIKALLGEIEKSVQMPAGQPEAPKPAASAEKVQVSISPKEIRADADGKGVAEVTIDIPAGLHINSSDPPARWLTPTRVEVKPIKAAIAYPEAKDERYEETVRISLTLELPSGEEGAEFEVKVSFQACTETECQLPEERTFNGVIYR